MLILILTRWFICILIKMIIIYFDWDPSLYLLSIPISLFIVIIIYPILFDLLNKK